MTYLKNNYKLILVLILGLVVILWFAINTPEPEKNTDLINIPSLTYTNASLSDQSIPIFSRGKVSASDIRHVTSEVPGLITYKNPKLVTGAFIEKDEVLIKLDQKPFTLDIAQKKSALDQAKLHLSETQAKAQIAQRNAGKRSSRYAKYLPQLQSAKSQIDAAIAALDYSKSQLEKAEIKAPISGKIIESNVNQGEYIQSLSAISKIYGVNNVEVRLPLNDHQIDILGLNRKALEDSSITVKINSFLDKKTVWQGVITRIEGERDKNQLLYVIASIDNNSPENSTKGPLFPGSFVEATIKGKVINDVVSLPRSLIQANNQIWVIDNNNKLARKELSILHLGKHFAFIKDGLSIQEQVVNHSFHQLISGLLVKPIFDPSVPDQQTVDTL